jgi:ketosteroid isomerase-like protein
MNVDDAPSTSESLPIVTKFLSHLRHGDIASCCELFADDAVIHEADSLPFGGARSGPDGFRSLVADINLTHDVVLGKPKVDAVGKTAIVRFDIALTLRKTGQCVEMPVVDVYTVEGGRISQLDVYYKDTKAIAELERTESSSDGGSVDAA